MPRSQVSNPKLPLQDRLALYALKYEQQLSEIAAEALKQMTELTQLRELVRLGEAAKAYRPSPVNPEPPSRFQPRDQLACTAREPIVPAARRIGSSSRTGSLRRSAG
jgi:hypothetical protein